MNHEYSITNGNGQWDNGNGQWQLPTGKLFFVPFFGANLKLNW
jgi:hypothetical protein